MYRACIRPRWDGNDGFYAPEQLGRGDGRSVCRRRGSRRGLHRWGMRVVVRMAFDAPEPNQTQLTLPTDVKTWLSPDPFGRWELRIKRDKGWYDAE